MSKLPTVKEQKHMSNVAALCCIICGNPEAQIHHTGTHLGGGRDHRQVIPLCVIHHTGGGYGVAIHAGKRAWENEFGTELDLLNEVAMRLACKKVH